jgi:hypothetical protein
VAGWDERRHVLQSVDVHAEPAGEDVLDHRRVDHDDPDLDACCAALTAQSGEQQQPGAEPEQPLEGQRSPGVEPQDHEHPHGDERGKASVARACHPSRLPRHRPLSRRTD